MPSAMRRYAIVKGYELGYVALAAIDRGPVFSVVARGFAYRPGTASRSPSQPPVDRETGGNVEGELTGDPGRSGKGYCCG